MSTTLNTRVQSKRDTSANWTQNNPVLLDGEVIVVDTNSGDVRFKVGNGTSTYTQLPFQDEYVLNQIPNVSNFVTAEDPESIVETVPPTFDGHTINDFVLQTQVVNSLSSVSTTLPLSANQGNILNQNITSLNQDISNLSSNIDLASSLFIEKIICPLFSSILKYDFNILFLNKICNFCST